MNLQTVHSLLQQLRGTSSTNAKLDILRRNVSNTDLRRFFELALDGRILFYLTAPGALPAPGSNVLVDNLFFQLLSSRQVTGNAAWTMVANVMAQLTAEAQKVLCNILDKDPKCGVNITTVNKAWPKLCWEFEVMKGDDIKDMDPSLAVGKEAEAKLDGRRALIVKEKGVVTVLSSNGKPIYNVEEAVAAMTALPVDNIVIDSEHFDCDWSTGSSLASSRVNAKTSATWALYAFDLLTLDEWRTGTGNRPFRERKQILEQLLTEHKPARVRRAPCYGQVRSVEHFKELQEQAVSENFEGLMLKDPNYIWRPKRDSKSWIKSKPVRTIDVRVIDFKPGDPGSKYQHVLGAFVCQTADGTVFNCGGGLTDAQRTDFWNRKAELVNSTIEIVEDIVPDRKKYASRFPRFLRLRPDKN